MGRLEVVAAAGIWVAAKRRYDHFLVAALQASNRRIMAAWGLCELQVRELS